MTNYNGQNISYDAYGNPTTYKGRQLMSYGANTYRYDSNGIRVQKNNTYYYWEGNKLIMEKRPDRTIFYGYDLTGIASMVIVSGSNSSSYYFKKNILGDVIEITDQNGVVLCNYYYDAWGKWSMNGPWPDIMYPDFIGNINPFRYRGYYYDTETGLYYLQSRYYDPETCRFINADDGRVLGIGMTAIGGTNLFSYCMNNPVNDVDPSGEMPKWLEDALLYVAYGGMIVAAAALIVGTGGFGAVAVTAALVATCSTTAIAATAISITAISTYCFSKFDEDSFSNREKIGKCKGNAPRNNRVQNKQTKDITIKLKLTPSQAERLHREISGKGLGYAAILELARRLFGK